MHGGRGDWKGAAASWKSEKATAQSEDQRWNLHHPSLQSGEALMNKKRTLSPLLGALVGTNVKLIN